MNAQSFNGNISIPKCLLVDGNQIGFLINRVAGIERSGRVDNEYYASVKFCPTRHGCTGVTNCDYSLGEPIGR